MSIPPGTWLTPHPYATGGRMTTRNLPPLPMASVAPGRVHLWELPAHWYAGQKPHRTPLLGLKRKGPDPERSAARALRNAQEAAGWLWLKSRPQRHTSPNGYEINMRQGFWTLNVPEQMPEWRVRLAFSSFMTWARNVAGVESYLWVAELTQRGRAHMHMLCNEWIDVDKGRAAWFRALQREGCGGDGPAANLMHVESVKSAKGARRYVSKYMGKDFGGRTDQLSERYLKAVQDQEKREEFVPEIRDALFHALAKPSKVRRRWGASQDLERSPLQVNGAEDPVTFRDLFNELRELPGVKFLERTDTGQPVYFNLDTVSKAGTPVLYRLLHS